MKSLRGAKSLDIIFAGTQNRKSLGFAEASLVFDNTDGTLPIEYTEVTVTRKIYRSGETGYYINKVPCRLKDIVELFMDTGIGMDKEDIATIFDAFKQLDASRKRSNEGSGMGLAVCNMLVKAMRGTIDIDSVPGRGSCFTVKIPQAVGSLSAVRRKQPDKNMVIEGVSGTKVLIVDDNNMNLNIEKNHLKHYGLDCDTCLSGELAIEKITSGIKYDLILMDDMMPSMSGTDTMRKLKYEMNFTNPIIVITANATTEAKEQYLNAGFDEFISKPVKREDLYNSVIKYLQK